LGQLALDRAPQPLQLVGLAPCGLEPIGWFGSRDQSFLAGPIAELVRVVVVIRVGVVIHQQGGRRLVGQSAAGRS